MESLIKNWPLFVPMLSGAIYHVGQKLVKSDVNPFLLFSYTYLIASLVMLVAFFLTKNSHESLMNIDRTFLLSIIVITLGVMGIEFGFYLVYKHGFKLSTAAMFSNTGQGLILLIVGIVALKEGISFKQIAGLVMALLSLVLLKK